MKVEHGVCEGHRDLVLRLEVDCRGELLAIAHRRQLERAHDGALVCDADSDSRAEPAVVEQLAQRLAESGAVDDLALANGIGGEGPHGGALDDDPAVDACFDRSHDARLDVESDHVAA